MTNLPLQEVQIIIIDEDRAGQRIDNFLFSRLNRVPKSHVYRLIRTGQVRVNGKRIKAKYHLLADDKVRIPPIRLKVDDKKVDLDERTTKTLEEAILFEDDDLLIINKPEGMAVHGGSNINKGLIDSLKTLRPTVKSLELAHRLDKPTSGCLILTKKISVLRKIHQQMRDHSIKKCYHVLVDGRWPKSLNKIDVPLKKNTLRSGERIVRVDNSGKMALTTFNVIATYQDATFIEARLKTGRTHQIRVHCQYAKHPVIGDHKYMNSEGQKKFKTQYAINRLGLHAYSLEFIHPNTNELLSVTAPYPASFQSALNNLRDFPKITAAN